MQFLFLILFGGVVSFILYLSYDKHVYDKKQKNIKEEDSSELKKEDLLFETEIVSDSKIPEKVLKKEEEVIKFKARRNKD